MLNFIQWNSSDLPEDIIVNCFLPTGVLIPLQSTVSTSLRDIKERVFYEAKKYPLFSKLKEPAIYCFLCINAKGKREQLEDERLCLRDVRPFRPFLKLVERQGAKEKELIDSKIKFLMGKTPKEFYDSNDVEIATFRSKYLSIANNVCSQRRQQDWEGRALCSYPPDLCDGVKLSGTVLNGLENGSQFLISVRFPREKSENTFYINIQDMASYLLSKVMHSKDAQQFVLKIVGKDSYLLGQYPLIEYKYIRDCIAKRKLPQVSIVPKSSLDVEDYAPVVDDNATIPPGIPPKSCLTVWDIDANFKFKLSHATNISVTAGSEIGVCAGLFHGSQSLCPVHWSREKPGPTPTWNEYLEFDISMCDIPRMAKLCLTLYVKRKNKEAPIAFAWVNTTLFDFRNNLRQGRIELYAWPVMDNFCDLNVIGTVVSNINTSTSPCLFIEFTQYALPGSGVMYPPFHKVLEKASTLAKDEYGEIFRRGEMMNIDLQHLTEREPLAEYSQEERNNIWFFRFECRDNFESSLPKVLCSIKWNNQEDVARMQALLQSWPLIAPEQALELLDYKYPEHEVRDFAVKCLEKLTDAELHLYLLQLVQVLKYEAYLDCKLAEFLLKRALWNRKIGHSLFWLLRAEMHLPEVSVRFGLLLEAYCRGSVGHMVGLSKQVEAMNKLRAITELMQCSALRKAEKEKCVDTMKECLRQVTFREAFSNLHSVVDPACKLRSLIEDGCKMMDSKMRPLWMVFENDDDVVKCEPTTIIFKNGDDLRQDMLTLQTIRIMDAIWQREGLDLEMTPYAVLPTGDKIGVIEVVTNANTLANIQKKEGGVYRGAFNKAVLLGWLTDQNETDEALKSAVERFTLSCAGYCVATYVLGVGDRHSDNIMVKRTGELLHIDFGHILGNVKQKFGIKRDRVPFVLSRDFVHVITNGGDSDKCEEFDRFRSICEKAYLALRRHGSLFINLFAMMLSTGLPELSTVNDIRYLKKSLGLEAKDKSSALADFQKKFNEAYKNSLSTSLNWAFHNWKRDNK